MNFCEVEPIFTNHHASANGPRESDRTTIVTRFSAKFLVGFFPSGGGLGQCCRMAGDSPQCRDPRDLPPLPSLDWAGLNLDWAGVPRPPCPVAQMLAGDWQRVVVDDFFPATDHQLAFGRCRGQQLWVCGERSEECHPHQWRDKHIECKVWEYG